MLRFAFVAFAAFVSAHALASQPAKQSMKITVHLIDGGEYFECDQEEGWSMTDDGCAFDGVFEVTTAKLPWSTSAGDFSISISKDGNASIDYSFGDADAGAAADFNLPMLGKRIVFGDKPYTFKLRGGDYASGTWNIEAVVKIEGK